MHGGEKQSEHDVRLRTRRARAGVDGLLDAQHHVVLHFADEAEAFPVFADAGHAAVEKHQGEVLRVLLAEFVVAPEHRAQAIGRVRGVDGAKRLAVLEKEAEAFFRQREEDVVLAREIAVNGGRAVLDALGDFSDRNLRVALLDEELPGGIENGPRNSLPLAFLTFFDSQVVYPEQVKARQVAPR